MESVKDILEQDLEMINKMLEVVERRIGSYIVDESSTLHYSKKKNGYQYYLRSEGGNRKYIRKGNIDLAHSMAQREYDLCVKTELLKQKRCINNMIKSYDIGAIGDIYTKICDAKRNLITPVIMPIDVFIQEWMQQNKGGMNSYPKQGKFMTNNGELVRSKSEKIIADMLDKYKIPYTYEPELKLENGRKAYPDFAALNVRTRQTIYWEHLGMITDGEYASANLEKINKYDKAGIKVCHNLILTMESDLDPLDVSEIRSKIEEYLL